MFLEKLHPSQLELSALSRLEQHFGEINKAILQKDARLVCWWSRDLVVVNIYSKKGDDLGYAEHPNSLQALLHANESMTTSGRHYFWFDHMDDGLIEKETWIDMLIKACGKIVVLKEQNDLMRVGMKRFVEQHLEVPPDLRRTAYRIGPVFWEYRGYTFKIEKQPQLKTGQEFPVSCDAIMVHPGRSPQDWPDYYKMVYTGFGSTLLQALKQATLNQGTEINKSNEHRFDEKTLILRS